MSEQPSVPPPIPQHVPTAADELRRSRTSAMIRGLIVGIVISAVIWVLGFTIKSDAAFMFALWAAGIKYVAALLLLIFRDWRMFATGLFISLPVGAVIFLGVCTGALMMHG